MRNGTQWTWHVLSTWYTTLKVLGVLRWKTWIIIVPLSISAGMMALLTGSAWYFAFGLAVASAIVCFLSAIIWQLWRCPIDTKVGERHIIQHDSPY
jgi:hypothetical protein